MGDTTSPTAATSLQAAAVATGGANLSWHAATDNLGLAHYRIYRDGTQVGEVSGTTLSYFDPPVVGGLHTFGVTAVDTAGHEGSAVTASATLVSPPGAPQSVQAVAGNAAALVSWTAPLTGGPFLGYSVSSNPESLHCATTGALSCIVTGLTNGQGYTFTVTATNNIGVGPASNPSNQVVPLRVPTRPTGVTGAPADLSVSVSWSAPSDSGAGSISAYTVTSSPEGRQCATSGALTCSVAGLTNGATYTFTAVATNNLGDSLASDPSGPVTPRTHPDPPANVVAYGQNLSALVHWDAPASGGSPVTGYDVTSSPGGKTCHSSGALSCTVAGLTNRLWYTFTVTATNVAGTSDQSLPSPAAMPLYGATFVPTTPTRIVDSRIHLGLRASLVSRTPVAFAVTKAANPASRIPAGAVAVTANLTAVNERSSGYFSLGPVSPGSSPATSIINFPAGDIRANSLVATIGADGRMWVVFVGRTGYTADVVLDITGYFVPNTSGATYVARTPNRILDTRPTSKIGTTPRLKSGVPSSFQVTGQSPDGTMNVPSDAVAVVGNLTAVNEGSSGFFSLTPARPASKPTTSTINFRAGDVRANDLIVPLGAGGTLWVTFYGSAGTYADAIFDVTGYFVQGTSGATYVPLTPYRAVDSRAGAAQVGLSGWLVGGTPAHFPVADPAADPTVQVPSDALAITANLTAVGEIAAGYYSLTPEEPVGVSTTSTINFPAGDTRANAITIPLGTDGGLWATYGQRSGAHGDIVFDVMGYFPMR